MKKKTKNNGSGVSNNMEHSASLHAVYYHSTQTRRKNEQDKRSYRHYAHNTQITCERITTKMILFYIKIAKKKEKKCRPSRGKRKRTQKQNVGLCTHRSLLNVHISTLQHHFYFYFYRSRKIIIIKREKREESEQKCYKTELK